MAKQQAVDGRQALAWLLEPTGTELDTGTLSLGTIVYVTGKGTSSVFGNTPKYKPFIVTSASITLASGDKCVKCNPYFLGFAKDKSLNKSKNTSEVTMDYDESQAYVTDGIVSVSGSISGSFVIEGAKYATTIIKRRFGDIIDATGATLEVLTSQTTEKDLLMFVWNARDAKVNDVLEIEIVPALITSMAIGGSYGSPQTFNIDFTGNSTDENNYEGATIQVKNAEGLLPAFTRAGADAQAAV